MPVEYSADLNPASILTESVIGIPNSTNISSTSYSPPRGSVAPPEPALSPVLLGKSGLKSEESSLDSNPATIETEPGAPGTVRFKLPFTNAVKVVCSPSPLI